ncbi:MAG: diphthamide biosynthesis enzyme Dph2 [Euryarchaeota archaeon]|nr:diphthamide biosynthesis enzyme Dph2 [Euryarchaeota archaeon]
MALDGPGRPSEGKTLKAGGARFDRGGNKGALRSVTVRHTPTEREQNATLDGYPDQTEYEYYIPLDQVVRHIRDSGAKRVGLQFPNGLRDRAWEVAETVERHTDATAVVSGDLCFGACDLADRDLVDMGVDLLVHFGHFEMPHVANQYKVPVLFVPVHTAMPLLPAAEAALDHLKGKKVAVTTVAQHSDKLAGVLEYLEASGVDCRTARGDARLFTAGQVLGCNYSSAMALANEVDCFLYLGTGDFHPLGLAMSSDKPVIAADPFTGEVRVFSDIRDRFIRRRWAAIAQARDAETFGVLVSTKTGQMRTAQALRVKEELEKRGKRAHIIALRDIVPDNLIWFRHLDAFVVAACPRVPIDDQARFDKPLLTIQELKAVFDPEAGYIFDVIDPHNYVQPEF